MLRQAGRKFLFSGIAVPVANRAFVGGSMLSLGGRSIVVAGGEMSATYAARTTRTAMAGKDIRDVVPGWATFRAIKRFADCKKGR
jgi:hypothetical protein